MIVVYDAHDEVLTERVSTMAEHTVVRRSPLRSPAPVPIIIDDTVATASPPPPPGVGGPPRDGATPRVFEALAGGETPSEDAGRVPA